MTHRTVPLKLVPPGLIVDHHEIGADGIIVHAHSVSRRAPVRFVDWHPPRFIAATVAPWATCRSMVGGSESGWQRGVFDAGIQHASARSSRSASRATSSRPMPDGPRASTCSRTRWPSCSVAVRELPDEDRDGRLGRRSRRRHGDLADVGLHGVLHRVRHFVDVERPAKAEGAVLLLPSRTRRRRAVAPTIRVLRKASSPARVMTPSLSLPAVEWSFGVSPSHAANWRPDRNRRGSGVFMTSIEAPTGPTPGICDRRRLHAFDEGVLLRLNGEQLTRESRQARVGRDPFEQRPDFTQTCRGDEPELGCVAADAVSELGPIAD